MPLPVRVPGMTSYGQRSDGAPSASLVGRVSGWDAAGTAARIKLCSFQDVKEMGSYVGFRSPKLSRRIWPVVGRAICPTRGPCTRGCFVFGALLCMGCRLAWTQVWMVPVVPD